MTANMAEWASAFCPNLKDNFLSILGLQPS